MCILEYSFNHYVIISHVEQKRCERCVTVNYFPFGITMADKRNAVSVFVKCVKVTLTTFTTLQVYVALYDLKLRHLYGE